MNRLGTLERNAAGDYELRYVRHYPHPPDKVWRALIEPSELQHWFPAAIEGERKQGAKLRFIFEGEAGPATEGVMRIYDPPRVLEFTWAEDVLRFELTADGSGSRLAFITTFGERATAPRSAAGWHNCLDVLGGRLGEAPKPSEVPWHELYRSYAAVLGPGDYPSFVKEAGELVRDAMQTPGLEGHAFRGKDDLRVELLRATRDAHTAEHRAAPQEYLFVLEGRYELQIGAGSIVLEGGMEFAFPEGFTLTGRVAAGTRLLRALRS